MRMNRTIQKLIEGARICAIVSDEQFDHWGIPAAARPEIRRYLKTWVVEKLAYALRLAQEPEKPRSHT